VFEGETRVVLEETPSSEWFIGGYVDSFLEGDIIENVCGVARYVELEYAPYLACSVLT
jgi:hypothetical protein